MSEAKHGAKGDAKYRPRPTEPDELGEIAEQEIDPSDEALDNPFKDDEPEPRPHGEQRSSEAEGPRQLEMHFPREVSGASWADQRAHNEVIDSLVERLRRQGL